MIKWNRFGLSVPVARQSGQVMVEYVIVFAALLAVVTIMALLLYAIRQDSNRTLDLVASEYP